MNKIQIESTFQQNYQLHKQQQVKDILQLLRNSIQQDNQIYIKIIKKKPQKLFNKHNKYNSQKYNRQDSLIFQDNVKYSVQEFAPSSKENSFLNQNIYDPLIVKNKAFASKYNSSYYNYSNYGQYLQVKNQFEIAVHQIYQKQQFDTGFQKLKKLAGKLSSNTNKLIVEIKKQILFMLGKSLCILKKKKVISIQNKDQNQQVYYCKKSITRQGFQISSIKPPLPKGIFYMNVKQINQLTKNYWKQQSVFYTKWTFYITNFIFIVIISFIMFGYAQLNAIVFCVLFTFVLIYGLITTIMLLKSKAKTFQGYNQVLDQFLKCLNVEYQKNEFQWMWYYNREKQILQIRKRI